MASGTLSKQILIGIGLGVVIGVVMGLVGALLELPIAVRGGLTGALVVTGFIALRGRSTSDPK